MSNRLLLPLAMLAGILCVVVWGISRGQLEPAEFTFNNGTEIKSFDPAILSDNASGRICWAIFEGLVRPGPVDRRPQPGVAERWDLSDDGLTYTFHLRQNAKWTNGDPVVADDFVYSMRRFLDPGTPALYVGEAHYLKNASRYSIGPRGVTPGDPVEIELHERPDGALPYARGRLVLSELVRVETDTDASEEELADAGRFGEFRTFVVTDEQGAERRFRIGRAGQQFAGAEACKQLLLDFREVGIRAVDKWTVEMVLEAPTSYWLDLVGFYPLAPVNRRCLETHGPQQWFTAENIVTNGPYKVEFRRLRDRIRLRKNPGHWDADNVAIESIDALVVESLTTAFNLYETGELDWSPVIPTIINQELLKQGIKRDDFYAADYLGTYFYAFNTTRKPFDDVRVRRALTLAIDRQEVIGTAGAGQQPALSLTPPGIAGYGTPRCLPSDAEEARRLLAEAGFPNGDGFPQIEILYNNGAGHKPIAELIRKQWRRHLKIDVSLRNEEWTTSLKSQQDREYDVARRSWIGDYPDPNTFLTMFVTDGENNQTGWSNAEYDRLLREAAVEVSPDKRMALLARAEQVLLDELPILPIYYYRSSNLVRPHVRGFSNNLQDAHPLWALSLDRSTTTAGELKGAAR